MQLSNQEAERLAKEGVDALQRGQPAIARARFESIAQSGRANGQIWLLLAVACRSDNDSGAEEAALDQLLTLEPQAVRGHIMKADCRANAGDERSALRGYEIALLIAANQELPADLRAELQRAEAWVAQFKARVVEQREAKLLARGLPPEKRSRRFQHSLDILAGRRQIFVQEPTGYYVPELPQVQFFDPADFDWVPTLEAAAAAIKQEITALLAAGTDGFRPYMQTHTDQPRADVNRLLDNIDWSALFLCENGTISDDIVARCPRTWAAVQAAPLPHIVNSPTVMFSLLRAGARIAPHTGTHNARLICHLPLIVPPNCGFRVGNDVRPWEEGKLLIFDDTIEHEAWNDSSEDRVVLIFDIWRPELSAREREEIAAFFADPALG
ncbi:aspartyl/asparaginyl beta-hydroxylase domain-containing protein [Sphingopyxis sp.]|uniref:aspartyl/asparaginyl beta-hydroxylase domain-containing protein n=1 Tax=Sphingopyxis sp. TaxID=1908224 RepID=UPI0025E0E761|nr:aspartyl/asparaginyl beta-hydroxylase domain-containing protein [Sphingopyxis sp.]MBK6414402.1 aspartyl/asparaginyl beta-hydroxylase domain-containing protein [Sphingopyxis sp.]